ncbi:MAG: hypothetical protein COB15_01865 [Flavobacteriales bacterium]|nr:MAG: hypothetical protein COB15_01865 [Flavobacteriales bacterium]
MKKIIPLFILLSFVCSFYAQTHEVLVGSEEYHKLKVSGELGDLIVSNKIKITSPKIKTLEVKKKAGSSSKTSSSCYKYFPPNGPPTYLPDDTSILVNLPFTFVFYGTSYTALWINDNGTVSFDFPHPSFSVIGFPYTNGGTAAEQIIAPFWADFHQAGALSGPAYYEVLPNALIVHWVEVGYFNAQDNKLNTMMLILTDGTSPLLQPGANVGFFYDDMQWTTGSASGGVNGFGGTPATVGVNKGNGLDYIQFGRFDGPGTGYDGPFNSNDSISWLDNKTFMFNVGNSNNIPPIIAGLDLCDTLRVCVGDSLPINASFLAPEANQTTWVEVDTTQANGFQITNLVSGTNSTAQLDAIFVASSTNLGVNIVTFQVYDNGAPPDTIQFDYIIMVDSMPFTPVITGDTSFCQGDTVTLDAGAGFDAYIWSNTDTTQTSEITTQGNYTVQAFYGGCSFTTNPYSVIELLNPVVAITGDTLFCPGDSVLLNATLGFDSYLWSSSINDTLDSVYVTQGTFTVTVTDTNGCQGISNLIKVKDFDDIGGIVGDTSYCLGDSVLLDAGAGFDSYLWSNGDTTQTTYVTQGAHTVDVTLFSCLATHLHTVNLINVPIPIITGVPSFCFGDSTLLDADSIGIGYDSITWNTSSVQTSQTINATTPGTYSVAVMLNGCPAVSQPFTVTSNPLPTPVIIGDLHFCSNVSNGTILTTANSYSSYNWSNSDTTSTTVALAGNNWITVTDSNDCPGTSPLVNVGSSAPANSVTGIVGVCPGEEITINASPGHDAYVWSTTETTDNITVGDGSYYVVVFDIYGCFDTTDFLIPLNPKPVANFTISPLGHSQPNQPVTFTDSSTISSGNISSWIWDFDVTSLGGANPMFGAGQGPHIVEYNIQGTYTVSLEVRSDKDCRDYITKEYLIVEDIISSNIMTPNGDGMNDFLVFGNLEYYSNNSLAVFNRWGILVFEQDAYQNNWGGGKLSKGTYFYVLTVEELENPIKGSFTILK